jgi:hypothetical protein
MGGPFRFGLRVVLVLVGGLLLLLRPSAGWVESAYSNGGYVVWQHAISRVTLPLPFSLGDVVGLLGIAAAVWIVVHAIRGWKRARWPAIASGVLSLAALAGFFAAWFVVSWGWNYDRAPLETRVRYDASAANDAAMAQLRERAMAQMNALAPAAHARADAPFDLDDLRAAWTPVVQRLGDTWTPNVGRPKVSIADPFMAATGTSGFINPLTLESQLATDLLWFERPFDLAHEWTHVAAFAREDEANYVAVLACLRSNDPVARYSGWMELFLYLPQKQHYQRSEFGPLVWQDFAAIRARNAHRLNLSLSRFTWHAYSAYLKTNHVASGVQNYNEVTRLMLAIPLDAQGLPVAR